MPTTCSITRYHYPPVHLGSCPDTLPHPRYGSHHHARGHTRPPHPDSRRLCAMTERHRRGRVGGFAKNQNLPTVPPPLACTHAHHYALHATHAPAPTSTSGAVAFHLRSWCCGCGILCIPYGTCTTLGGASSVGTARTSRAALKTPVYVQSITETSAILKQNLFLGTIHRPRPLHAPVPSHLPHPSPIVITPHLLQDAVTPRYTPITATAPACRATGYTTPCYYPTSLTYLPTACLLPTHLRSSLWTVCWNKVYAGQDLGRRSEWKKRTSLLPRAHAAAARTRLYEHTARPSATTHTPVPLLFYGGVAAGLSTCAQQPRSWRGERRRGGEPQSLIKQRRARPFKPVASLPVESFGAFGHLSDYPTSPRLHRDLYTRVQATVPAPAFTLCTFAPIPTRHLLDRHQRIPYSNAPELSCSPGGWRTAPHARMHALARHASRYILSRGLYAEHRLLRTRMMRTATFHA